MNRRGFPLTGIVIFLYLIVVILLLTQDGQIAWRWLPITYSATKGHIEIIITYLVILALALIFCRLEGVRVRLARRADAKPALAVLASTLGGVVILALLNPAVISGSDYLDGALTVVQLVVVVGCVEEFAFRGYIQGKLLLISPPSATGSGIPRAVFISAAFFALMHAIVDFLSSPATAVDGLVIQFMGGLFFGLIYYMSGSLLLSILSHGFYDLGGSILSGRQEIYSAPPLETFVLYLAEFLIPTIICYYAYNRTAIREENSSPGVTRNTANGLGSEVP